MKCVALLVASAAAVASAQQQGECDSFKLISIVSGPSGAACTAATTYSPASLQIPTGDLLKAVCSNPSCKTLLAEITAAVPTECTFGGKQVKSTIVDKFPGECANALGTTGAPSNTPGPSSTAPSNSPGTTTMAPSNTPMTSSMAPTTMPTPTTTAPAMTTTMPPVATEASSSSSDGSESGTGSGSGMSSSDGSVNAPAGAVPTPAPTTSGASQLTAVAGGIVALVLAAIL